MSDNQFDREILELVNQERAEAGIDPLSIDSQLDQAAHLHTDEMVQADLLSHQLTDEPDLAERVSEAGYDGAVAENVAAGDGTLFATPEQVVEGWMNSPKHRANILNPEFTDLGVGYASAVDDNDVLGDFDVYWTQVFGTEGEADSLAVDSQLAQSGQALMNGAVDTSYQILSAEDVTELISSANYDTTLEENASNGELVFAISGEEVDKLLDNPAYQEYLSGQDFSLGVDSSIESADSTYFAAGEFEDGSFTITGFGAVSPAFRTPIGNPRG